MNAYTNVGYLNRAPLFNSVFDINNNVIEGYENQYVKAVEVGVKYARGKLPPTSMRTAQGGRTNP